MVAKHLATTRMPSTPNSLVARLRRAAATCAPAAISLIGASLLAPPSQAKAQSAPVVAEAPAQQLASGARLLERVDSLMAVSEHDAMHVEGSSSAAPMPEAPAPLSGRERDAHIKKHGRGTYLPQVLDQGGGHMYRWHDRQDEPIRVAIATNGHEYSNYDPRMADIARAAFGVWETGDVPVRFQFVEDPGEAEILVTWTEEFPEGHHGVAMVYPGEDGYIMQAEIKLATNQKRNGIRQSLDVFRSVAIHEVGHALGIGHSNQPRDLMHPTVSRGSLSPNDRKTARVMYEVAPGRVR